MRRLSIRITGVSLRTGALVLALASCVAPVAGCAFDGTEGTALPPVRGVAQATTGKPTQDQIKLALKNAATESEANIRKALGKPNPEEQRLWPGTDLVPVRTFVAILTGKPYDPASVNKVEAGLTAKVPDWDISYTPTPRIVIPFIRKQNNGNRGANYTVYEAYGPDKVFQAAGLPAMVPPGVYYPDGTDPYIGSDCKGFSYTLFMADSRAADEDQEVLQHMHCTETKGPVGQEAQNPIKEAKTSEVVRKAIEAAYADLLPVDFAKSILAALIVRTLALADNDGQNNLANIVSSTLYNVTQWRFWDVANSFRPGVKDARDAWGNPWDFKSKVLVRAWNKTNKCKVQADGVYKNSVYECNKPFPNVDNQVSKSSDPVVMGEQRYCYAAFDVPSETQLQPLVKACQQIAADEAKRLKPETPAQKEPWRKYDIGNEEWIWDYGGGNSGLAPRCGFILAALGKT